MFNGVVEIVFEIVFSKTSQAPSKCFQIPRQPVDLFVSEPSQLDDVNRVIAKERLQLFGNFEALAERSRTVPTFIIPKIEYERHYWQYFFARF